MILKGFAFEIRTTCTVNGAHTIEDAARIWQLQKQMRIEFSGPVTIQDAHGNFLREESFVKYCHD